MNQRNCQLPSALRSVAQCCSSQYFTQYFELQSDKMIAHPSLPHRFLCRPPCSAPCNGRTICAPVAVSTRVPDSQWTIGDPAPLVGMARRPPRPVAIATCPVTISSPCLSGALKGLGDVSILPCLSPSRMFAGKISWNGTTAIRQQWMLSSTRLNYSLETGRAR